MKEIAEVSCEEIRVSPFQPRQEFNEQALEELSASIKAIGIIQPPVVRKICSGTTLLYYELIAGERRWRAAKMAGLKTISVIISLSDEIQAAKESLIENLQREDLSPIETAFAFKNLIDTFRMTQEEVATKVGKKRSTIANYLRLLHLPDSIQKALGKGTITMGHAKAILSLNSPDLQERLHDLITKNQMTVREAERESCRLVKGTRALSPAQKADVHTSPIKNQLEEALGTKVEIVPSSQAKGKISIHYYSLEDLERLTDHILISAQGK